MKSVLMPAIAVWLAIWILVLGVNARRDYVGRLGFADWTARAADGRRTPQGRQMAMRYAQFELQIARRARVWEWRALGLGAGLPAAAMGFITLYPRRRKLTPILRIGE